MPEKSSSRTGLFSLSMLVFAMAVAQASPKKATGKNTSSANAPIQTTAISTPSKPGPLVDTATIRKLYLDGDFDQAIVILETGIKEKRPFKHTDSVFIFKHLGVMYAAKYDTREKGKYYMHQLLMTEPTAKIMDMYASDMIYMIFKNIQDEFDSNRMRRDRAEANLAENGRANSNEKSDSKSDQSGSGNSKDGHAVYYWVGAGAVAAAGVAAYFVLQAEPKTTTTSNSHTVP